MLLNMLGMETSVCFWQERSQHSCPPTPPCTTHCDQAPHVCWNRPKGPKLWVADSNTHSLPLSEVFAGRTPRRGCRGDSVCFHFPAVRAALSSFLLCLPLMEGQGDYLQGPSGRPRMAFPVQSPTTTTSALSPPAVTVPAET